MNLSNLKYINRWLHIQYLTIRSCLSSPLFNLKARILILAPHPDDEVIGCGGLIARIVAEGRTPHIVILSGGEGSHRGCCGLGKDEITSARRRLTDDALRVLSVDREYIYELNFPDGGISPLHSEAAKLKQLIDEIAPDTVFVPHWGEGWPDHVNAAKMVKEMLPIGTEVYEYCVWMWYYNVWRGLDWRNARRLKMTPREHQLKLEAMDAYIRPLAPCGNPWSGVLPPLFIKANSGVTELYFKVK